MVSLRSKSHLLLSKLWWEVWIKEKKSLWWRRVLPVKSRKGDFLGWLLYKGGEKYILKWLSVNSNCYREQLQQYFYKDTLLSGRYTFDTLVFK